MADSLPLPALLSQALVAFAIEFDNEFEHQTPHRTTNHGRTAAAGSVPWLVSMAMWIQFLRFVPDDSITVGELQRQAGLTNKDLKIWVMRLSEWWGYLAVYRDPAARASDWVIRPTSGGRKALQVWRPLTGIVEQRWDGRFGKGVIDGLRQSLRALVQQFDTNLSDCLPILGFEMFSRLSGRNGSPVSVGNDCALPFLLAKALLRFAIEYENDSHLSLAISANILRLAEREIRLSGLPRLSGVSKEAIAMGVKRLQEAGLATVHAGTEGSRLKTLSLTKTGQVARNAYFEGVRKIEQRWQAAFGPCVSELRTGLEHLSPGLAPGLKPYPDGWRASLPDPDVLPHYPMILHRGGFPDGS